MMIGCRVIIFLVSILKSEASFIGRGHRGTYSSVEAIMQRSKKPSSTIVNRGDKLHTPRGGGVAPLQLSPNVVFNNAPMWESMKIIGGANLLGFFISLATGSHLHLDLLGTGAFALGALPTLVGKGAGLTRVKVSSLAVVVWGTKLAGFLFYRALKLGHDGRLDSTLSTVSGTVGFWVISALWGIICSLPHTLGTTSSSPGNTIFLRLGTVIYVVGLVTESLADYQKWSFKNTNPGDFCGVGLWSISQHPNWFGNLLLWAGIFVMNLPALSPQRIVIGLLSPLFMWTLFYGQASGSITNAVELANNKYGNDPKYQEYVESVPLIVPTLFGEAKNS